MIGVFESIVRMSPGRVCFTFVDEQGKAERYTFRQTRLIAAGMARRLQDAGVRRGDCVLVDLPNCAEFVFLMMAAAYGAFALVPVNNRLTAAEKQSRQFELERSHRFRISYRIDEARAKSLLERVKADLEGKNPCGSAPPLPPRNGGAARSTSANANATRTANSQRTAKPWGFPLFAQQRDNESPTQGYRRGRVIMGAQQDAEEEAIHFAERQAHLFDIGECALIMFTSGTTGKPKAVPLTWRHLQGSARASNESLNELNEGLWQAALPLYHIGGMQVVVRSILNRSPFILYAHFDAQRVLDDAQSFGATHVSVVDKMLQDLLAADERDVLAQYRCILLGGGALNRKTLVQALRVGARVYASYGMTETSSQIAHTLVTRHFDGGMQLISGYAARIVDADAEGYGRLAVRGPGVFQGYANAHAAFTVDGFFLTGDTAALRMGKIYVKERTSDMFVSGGENVYPAEIANKLLRIPGVVDAFVFGVPDAKWGRRPVAFVERAHGQGKDVRSDTVEFSASVYAQLAPRLSKLYLPRYLFTIDELPRTGIGKVDRAAVERLYESRLEIKRITLYLLRIPFKVPFKTAKTTLTYRESLIVEVTDHAGRTGLGECTAFATDWYLPETIDQDVAVLQQVIAPKVLSEAYLHPREAAVSLAALSDAASFPLACGALEPALWDLHGKIVGKPLWQLVAEEAQRLGSASEGDVGEHALLQKEMAAAEGEAAEEDGASPGKQTPASSGKNGAASRADARTRTLSVPAGAVIGLGTPIETVETVRRCVEAGYKRVKLKVAPGSSVACVREVRKAFPQLMITLDANQSFTERDMGELRALDACGAAWIEEPLDLSRVSQRGGKGAVFGQLARLQRTLSTPVCLDESFTCAHEAHQALEYPELRCFAIKIGKFGGVSGALDFALAAQVRGAQVWMGGMYDTGVSKRLHAAFQVLPGIDVPGDIGATSRYFAIDVTDPPYTVARGMVALNRAGSEHGLGCSLCRPALANVQFNRIVIE